MSRTCESCGERLPVMARRDARFCGSRCRVRAYRRRHAPLPESMTSRARWVRWESRARGARVTKVPLTVDGCLASVSDPGSWSSYADVKASSVGDGVGIVLGDGLGCIDLDDAIVDGVLAPWAAGIVAQHRDEAVLVEVSPSGRGVHIFLPLPEGPGRRIREGDVKIEIYSRARYVTVTGRHI